MTTDKRIVKGAEQSPAAPSGPEVTLRPAVDIFENDHSISLFADLPGVPESGLNLEVDDKTLTIQGDIEIDMPEKMESLYADVRSTRYRRAFTLSNELDTARIAATLNDGVLEVTIPKREEVLPRRIEITAG